MSKSRMKRRSKCRMRSKSRRKRMKQRPSPWDLSLSLHFLALAPIQLNWTGWIAWQWPTPFYITVGTHWHLIAWTIEIYKLKVTTYWRWLLIQSTLKSLVKHFVDILCWYRVSYQQDVNMLCQHKTQRQIIWALQARSCNTIKSPVTLCWQEGVPCNEPAASLFACFKWGRVAGRR